MNPKPSLPGCDCEAPLNRRDFIRQTVSGVAAAGTAALALPRPAQAAPPRPSSETLVATLHRSLTEDQRKAICLPFHHPKRSEVDNNWFITEPRVSKLFARDQQELIKDIFLGLHSPDYADTVFRQVEHDSGKEGFFGGTSVALFGEPGSGQFEFVLTGRHVTRRCDGDSVAGTAFGGPIFYGHAAAGENEKADHPGNAYWFQARRANEVFQAFDGRQRKLALLERSRGEDGTDTVKLTGRKSGLPGIPMTELARDQRELVRKVLGDLLAPFRAVDAAESLKLIETAGLDHLHLAFYQKEDIGDDRVWDVWQIEGPSMVWYFRGKPHVHVWAHIKAQA